MVKNKKIETINKIFKPLFLYNLNDPLFYQVYGGRASGKTFATNTAMVNSTYSKHKHKILYIDCMFSYSTYLSYVRTAIMFLESECDFEELNGVFTNKTTGSTINFISTQRLAKTIENYYFSYTTLVFPDTDDIVDLKTFNLAIYNFVRHCQKNKPLKIVLISNLDPNNIINKDWFYKDNPKEDRMHDTVFMHSTYIDNIENLNPNLIDRVNKLKESNPTYYKNKWLSKYY